MLTRRGENGPVSERRGPSLQHCLERGGADQLAGAALSNDVTVSGPGEGNGRGEEPREGSSVLSNLPRTRPQRASPRRAAARSSAAAAEQPAANGNGSAPRKSAKPAATSGTRQRKPAAKAKAKAPRRRAPEAVPRQGYESVEERATGPVQPPGGAEFLGTAAEIVTELAKAGISGSERLVRDVLSRLGR